MAMLRLSPFYNSDLIAIAKAKYKEILDYEELCKFIDSIDYLRVEKEYTKLFCIRIVDDKHDKANKRDLYDEGIEYFKKLNKMARRDLTITDAERQDYLLLYEEAVIQYANYELLCSNPNLDKIIKYAKKVQHFEVTNYKPEIKVIFARVKKLQGNSFEALEALEKAAEKTSNFYAIFELAVFQFEIATGKYHINEKKLSEQQKLFFLNNSRNNFEKLLSNYNLGKTSVRMRDFISVYLTQIYIMLGLPFLASETVDRIENKEANNDFINYHLILIGDQYLANGDNKRALELYEKNYSNPNSKNIILVLQKLISLYASLDVDCSNYISDLLIRDYQSGKSLMSIANYYIAKGNYEEAIIYLYQIINGDYDKKDKRKAVQSIVPCLEKIKQFDERDKYMKLLENWN